jgi:ligand-binding SRPBCC domain-containing protein
MRNSLTFETKVSVSQNEAWDWITSFKGIAKEMAPYLKMTSPKGIENISHVEFVPGKPLFFSWIKLFGFMPIDYSKLTLVELEPGVGFIEQSPMGSMKVWRHERKIVTNGSGCSIVDNLIFEPRAFNWLISRFVTMFFQHRHAMLKKYLG